MALQGNAEYIIENVAGCGTFQVTFVLAVVIFYNTAMPYSIMFMSFGNYNPGWRCLDNTTGWVSTNDTAFAKRAGINLPTGNDEEEAKYAIGSCDDYNACKDVEFNPDSSTIVTQWGLVCDKAWIVSIIISMQMVGMMIGSCLGGYTADLIGRKKTVCIGLAGCSVSHFISSFSVSWTMFIVFRFLIGMCATSNVVIMLLYLSEYMTVKWRAIMISAPLWYVGCLVLTFVVWLVRDWRQADAIGAALSTVCLFIFVFVAPESLRWLETKNKRQEFVAVSRKIVKLNTNNDFSFDGWELVETEQEADGQKRYNIWDLFRKGYKFNTICITFLQFSVSMLSYAISFGAKSFYGDIYLNLFLLNIMPVPFCFLSMFLIRVLSRRAHGLVFLLFTILCCVVSILILLFGDEAAKEFGSTILISLAQAALDSVWSGVYSRNAEMYPTVVRGIAVGAGSMSARIGGILAPFLIPKDQSVLYIFMIIMTVLAVVCCVIYVKLPETKGVALRQTFSDA